MNEHKCLGLSIQSVLKCKYLRYLMRKASEKIIQIYFIKFYFANWANAFHILLREYFAQIT